MQTSRRKFMTHALQCAAAAGMAAGAGEALAEAKPAAEASSGFKIYPIGKIEKQGEIARIRIFEPYVDGLLGLEAWSHVNVFYWFDKNDTPQQRRILQVHPQGNDENPLTGVFACRAPVRPNLIALSVCKIVSVKDGVVTLDGIDAFDQTPVIDLKPFIPPDAPRQDVRVPAWTKAKGKAKTGAKAKEKS